MKKNNFYTTILIVVGGLLIFVVGFYSNQISKDAQTRQAVVSIFQRKSKTAINENGKAILSFLLLNGKQKIGQPFDVDVVLNSQKQKSYGVDIIINYDPSILELDPMMEKEAGDPGAMIINKWQDGEIVFSYLAPAGISFQGETKIAELTFTPKKAGTTDLKFNFEPNSSTDCNVAGDNGQDILNKVGNAQFIVE